MKCKNCGANYKTRELKCPYCNTENLIGKVWQSERSQAELDYEEERKKVAKSLLSPYMAERILNRATLILIGLYIVSFLVVVLVIALSFPVQDLIFKMNKTEIEAQMEEYYSAGEYDLLDIYMDDNYVERKDYYTYNQITSQNFNYKSYMEHRLAFENMSKEEQLEDEKMKIGFDKGELAIDPVELFNTYPLQPSVTINIPESNFYIARDVVFDVNFGISIDADVEIDVLGGGK